MEFLTSASLNAAFLLSILAMVALGLGVVYGLLGTGNSSPSVPTWPSR